MGRPLARRSENIRLSAAIARYMERISAEGQAETTLRTNRYYLERFRKTVSTRRDPDPYLHLVTPAQVDDYFFGPSGIRRGISALTFNRYRSLLKVFYEYALAMRWVDANPVDRISIARPDAPKQRLLLGAGELISLLDYCTNPIERVACAIAMNTGLRANDLKRLTVFDASLSGGVIQTEIRKTNKLDVKPITPMLHAELDHWLDKYAELGNLSGRGALPNTWLLVPTFYWAGPPRAGVERPMILRPEAMHTNPWRLVQRPLTRMGYPAKGEGMHTLRRSSARVLFELLRDGGEGRDHALMIVRDYLNHSSVTQTEVYLGLSHERALRDSLLKNNDFLGTVMQAEQARVTGDVALPRVGMGGYRNAQGL